MKKCREELDIVFVPRVPARRPGVAVWRGGLARELRARRLRTPCICLSTAREAAGN